MKGDFTRFSFDPRKHYSGVLQQQGRVQLDADSNEQVAIDAHRDRAVTRDLIGACGAPQSGGGFEISTTEDGDIAISAGRLYVEGTLCQLDADTTYARQPDLPETTQMSPVDGQTWLVYLDVWERHLSAIEEPDLREPALGGPDTATRTKTVAQVKVAGGLDPIDCGEPIEGWPPPPSGGLLAARIDGDRAASYTGRENELYRIEIHQSGEAGTATFKWSRRNGSIVFAVYELLESDPSQGSTPAVIEPVGPGDTRGLNEGDWVEMSGEESELSLTPGSLLRVSRVDEHERVVWLKGDVFKHSKENRLKVRRWDGAGELVEAAWVELEEGVAVEFSGGHFATGDYWVIPARTGQAPIEWPPEPPRGIEHSYCRLASLTWKQDASGGWSATVRDCRPSFGPLAAGGVDHCLEEIAELRSMLEEQAAELAKLKERSSRGA